MSYTGGLAKNMPQIDPLSIRKRRAYLILFFTAFVLLIPIVILYSQGYRLDNFFRIVRTGGVYVSVDQPDVEVYINGKLYKKSGLFQKSFFIQNLLPGYYSVAAKKDGYNSWAKEISVYEEKVTELHSFLLPDNPKLTEVHKYLDRDGNQTDIEKFSSGINPSYSSVLALFSKTDAAAKIKIKSSDQNQIVDADMITSHSISLQRSDDAIEVKWSGDLDSAPYFFCLDGGICRKKVSVSFSSVVENFNFYPSRDDLVIVSLADGIYVAEIDGRSTRNIEPLYEKSGADFRVENDSNLYIKDGVAIYQVNL